MSGLVSHAHAWHLLLSSPSFTLIQYSMRTSRFTKLVPSCLSSIMKVSVHGCMPTDIVHSKLSPPGRCCCRCTGTTTDAHPGICGSEASCQILLDDVANRGEPGFGSRSSKLALCKQACQVLPCRLKKVRGQKQCGTSATGQGLALTATMAAPDKGKCCAGETASRELAGQIEAEAAEVAARLAAERLQQARL